MLSIIEVAAGAFIILGFMLFVAITIAVIEWSDRKKETRREMAARIESERISAEEKRERAAVIRFAEAFNKSHGA